MRAVRAVAVFLATAAAVPAQAPPVTLVYDVPRGWVMDAPGARNANVELMFLPRGKTPESTDRAIAIAYQAKDPKVPALADLESFVRADMAVTRQSFPEMLAERWQPKGLDPAKIPYLSVELYGSKPNRPPPHRVIIIDSGDGFYSLTYTAETRAILHEAEVDAFFDSLRLSPAAESR
jgi:hypothetical protein